MKKIKIEIDCAAQTCGNCHCQTYRHLDGGWSCEAFSTKLIKDDVENDFIRCQECKAAETV